MGPRRKAKRPPKSSDELTFTALPTEIQRLKERIQFLETEKHELDSYIAELTASIEDWREVAEDEEALEAAAARIQRLEEEITKLKAQNEELSRMNLELTRMMKIMHGSILEEEEDDDDEGRGKSRRKGEAEGEEPTRNKPKHGSDCCTEHQLTNGMDDDDNYEADNSEGEVESPESNDNCETQEGDEDEPGKDEVEEECTNLEAARKEGYDEGYLGGLRKMFGELRVVKEQSPS